MAEQYNQDFYQSGYNLDEVPQQPEQQAPVAGWQASTAPTQGQWSGEGQQTNYPDPQGYRYAAGGDSGVSADTQIPGPGSLGHMDGGTESYSAGEGYGSSFEDEPPLLQELGIDFRLIVDKTFSVLNPLKVPNVNLARDTDLTGPLIFCLLFGVVLLLVQHIIYSYILVLVLTPGKCALTCMHTQSGKVQFGYIYGVSFLGCLSVYFVLNLMSERTVAMSCVVSILGYCLLPMVGLSCLSTLFTLQGIIGTVLSVVIIIWCSYSASNLFVTALAMNSQQLLIAYPCALVYGVFALLTIF